MPPADRVVSVTPAHDGPVNRGHACVKGRFAHGFVRSPQRLTTPLIRRDGELRPAPGRRRSPRRRRAGSDPFGARADAIAAISSARATNEENYLMQKLMRTVVGTNNIDNCSRICHAPSAAGLTAPSVCRVAPTRWTTSSARDFILLAGTNATEAHPVVGARIKQQVLRGARLVVVDPRRTDLAGLADVHLQAQPDSNVAVFNGLARLLLEEG